MTETFTQRARAQRPGIVPLRKLIRMMHVDQPPAPGVIPQPVTVPDLTPDAALIEEIESAFEDIRVGVAFDSSRRVYVYTAPPITHVHSIVIVPANSFCPDPQIATVVTLDPPPYRGPVKRVLAVLS